ncbi:MAG: hypothetical protein P4L81_01830 [Candidatus Pacebacteria bacterium]|nr:hypothetical protein [Candidatus Paceibacterota bacterium]
MFRMFLAVLAIALPMVPGVSSAAQLAPGCVKAYKIYVSAPAPKAWVTGTSPTGNVTHCGFAYSPRVSSQADADRLAQEYCRSANNGFSCGR